nr:protein PYRICULARIA ORYZAE RESISTANCE 21-like [Quercus suber]POE85243.1 hypothetical protein CFP56_67847 [Quercus suber]
MGVDKKTTLMVIKVDLQCSRCYKKIKKVICRIPQIQDQVYNEKENLVIIKVVCCSPEKIKQKIICKGGSTIKGIEIKEVEKPKKRPEKPNETVKPNEPEDPEKPKGPGKPKEAKGPEKPKEKPIEIPAPPPHCPPPHCPPQCPPPYPVFRTCRTECYGGRGGGPCYSGHRPPLCCDGYYGRPIYDSYGGGGGYRSSYVSPCDYFSEENSSGCSIM